MKKITRATFKSFVKKNADKLLINVGSKFDGMIDGVMCTGDASFHPAQKANHEHENNLNIQGVWLVLGSRDYFTTYEDASHEGIQVTNCCGRFTVAVAK